MNKCICKSFRNALHNKHYKGRTIDMHLLEDDEGYGIIVLELGKVIATFDICYCPMCGRELKQEG